jgi:hypothetical protein
MSGAHKKARPARAGKASRTLWERSRPRVDESHVHTDDRPFTGLLAPSCPADYSPGSIVSTSLGELSRPSDPKQSTTV